ncbi:MAG: V-type ATP synthase subunit D [Porphyromonadaceae bacterium]|jgi:V-type ATPase, D subunit|uniref:V-type ATPase, D subunit n=2 Tax=Porphyromonas TaxID=836 RepID=A0A134B2Z0_9PORP|nr:MULTISPECIES: V-type ATP synthase subunit D [Porphyromonas]KXB72306.1 V-type ATPase, D subunit [Porphyromonadaceae bacterium KA00676]MBF1267521.1 V-type ATP synthase subunit D [Porphyromonadaceae bacterium]KXB74301.1 V-type ATPase, D subunit [Porphyromonas somerae]MBF1312343.1 V-type ATP synthase subunit D [Porphyromonadaceae bacterium]MBF1317148.1 V-type ATP synthase subunit D [Porphyromonadaceae bacterium]
MAIRFQYNKTSLQQQEKALKMRLRTLPTIKSKESALRQQVKQTKREVDLLEEKLEQELRGYQGMVSLWDEFDASLITVDRVDLSMKKIAGVLLPVLDGIHYEVRPFSIFNAPSWWAEGIELLKTLATTGIEAEFLRLKMEYLEHARKKTTQKVNLFEKVQIPGYQDAIRKIKRFLEDEESLSKASQKIMRTNIELRKQKEEEEAAQ